MKKSVRMAALLSAVACFSLITTPVYAQDDEGATPQVQEGSVEDASDDGEEVRPVFNQEQLDIVREKLEKLMETVAEEDLNTVYRIRQSYGMIQSVKIVSADVEKAVKSCGKENKDIKGVMDERYKIWSEAVLPVIDDAEKALKKAINEQKAVKKKDLNEYLDAVQEAAEHKEGLIEKTPVTSLEACRELVKSMTRTQENLTALLQSKVIDKINRITQEPEIEPEADESKENDEAAKQDGAETKEGAEE